MGPLLMIILVGFAFQSDKLTGVTVGVYNEVNGFDETIRTMVEAQGLNATFYQEQEPCVQDNKDGTTAVCLAVTKDEGSIIADVNLDFSRSQFAAAVLSQINTIFDEVKDERLSQFGDQLSEGAEESKTQLQEFQRGMDQLIQTLNQTREEIDNQTRNMDLGVEDQNLGDIPEINRRFQVVKANLQETDAYLSTVNGEIETNRDALESQAAFAAELENQYGCASDYPDILEADSAEGVVNILRGADQPECVLITNYQEYFQERVDLLEEIEGGVESQQTKVQDYIDQADNLTNTPTTSLVGDEIDSVKNAQRQAALNLSRGLGQIVENVQRSRNEVDGLANSSLLNALQGAEENVDPVQVRVNRYRELRGTTMLDLLFPGILACLASFVGILVGSVLTMKERTSNAGFRNTISPVSTTLLQFSATITGSLICASQTFIVLIVGKLAFGINASITFGLIPFLFMSGAVFTLIGQLIGTFSPNEEVSTLLSILTAVTFLLFSPLIIPLAKMHPLLGELFSYSPFNLSMDVLRQVLIFAASLFNQPVAFFVLLGMLVGSVVVLMVQRELRED